jgi:hypothetical protein
MPSVEAITNGIIPEVLYVEDPKWNLDVTLLHSREFVDNAESARAIVSINPTETPFEGVVQVL